MATTVQGFKLATKSNPCLHCGEAKGCQISDARPHTILCVNAPDTVGAHRERSTGQGRMLICGPDGTPVTDPGRYYGGLLLDFTPSENFVNPHQNTQTTADDCFVKDLNALVRVLSGLFAPVDEPAEIRFPTDRLTLLNRLNDLGIELWNEGLLTTLLFTNHFVLVPASGRHILDVANPNMSRLRAIKDLNGDVCVLLSNTDPGVELNYQGETLLVGREYHLPRLFENRKSNKIFIVDKADVADRIAAVGYEALAIDHAPKKPEETVARLIHHMTAYLKNVGTEEIEIVFASVGLNRLRQSGFKTDRTKGATELWSHFVACFELAKQLQSYAVAGAYNWKISFSSYESAPERASLSLSAAHRKFSQLNEDFFGSFQSISMEELARIHNLTLETQNTPLLSNIIAAEIAPLVLDYYRHEDGSEISEECAFFQLLTRHRHYSKKGEDGLITLDVHRAGSVPLHFKKVIMPTNYFVGTHGVTLETGEGPISVCGTPIFVTKILSERNIRNENVYSMIVDIASKNIDGSIGWQSKIISKKSATTSRTLLADLGESAIFLTENQGKRLSQYLISQFNVMFATARHGRVADNAGHQSDGSFYLGKVEVTKTGTVIHTESAEDESDGQAAHRGEIIYNLSIDSQALNVIRSIKLAGTFEQQRVGLSYFSDSEVAKFMLTATLASVPLRDLHQQGAMIETVGDSQRGKSITLMACNSLFYDEGGSSLWSSTAPALFRIAAAMPGLPLCLEDTNALKESNAGLLGDVVMTICNNFTKRSVNVPLQKFSNIIISSGEQPADRIIAAAIQKNESASEKVGGRARIFTLDPPWGNDCNPEKYIERGRLIKVACSESYGHVGLRFVEVFLRERHEYGKERMDAQIQESIKFYTDWIPKIMGKNVDISHILNVVAVIEYTARLAEKYDIFPWKLEVPEGSTDGLTRVLSENLLRMILRRDGGDPHKVTDYLKTVMDFVEGEDAFAYSWTRDVGLDIHGQPVKLKHLPAAEKAFLKHAQLEQTHSDVVRRMRDKADAQIKALMIAEYGPSGIPSFSNDTVTQDRREKLAETVREIGWEVEQRVDEYKLKFGTIKNFNVWRCDDFDVPTFESARACHINLLCEAEKKHPGIEVRPKDPLLDPLHIYRHIPDDHEVVAIDDSVLKTFFKHRGLPRDAFFDKAIKNGYVKTNGTRNTLQFLYHGLKPTSGVVFTAKAMRAAGLWHAFEPRCDCETNGCVRTNSFPEPEISPVVAKAETKGVMSFNENQKNDGEQA